MELMLTMRPVAFAGAGLGVGLEDVGDNGAARPQTPP